MEKESEKNQYTEKKTIRPIYKDKRFEVCQKKPVTREN